MTVRVRTRGKGKGSTAEIPSALDENSWLTGTTRDSGESIDIVLATIVVLARVMPVTVEIRARDKGKASAVELLSALGRTVKEAAELSMLVYEGWGGGKGEVEVIIWGRDEDSIGMVEVDATKGSVAVGNPRESSNAGLEFVRWAGLLLGWVGVRDIIDNS
jgi:hypothetical protein